MTGGAFAVATVSGTAAELHGRQWPSPLRRQLWLLRVVRPALVLGSSQDAAIVDEASCDARGVDIVRRHSGGGLVLLEETAQAWVDVFIPADDALWTDDLSAAFDWLGRCWQSALGSLGIDSEVLRGPLEVGEWGKLVCFAGRGPGELTSGAAKVVGMSMRRTRAGARFQTMALTSWRPEALVELLDSRTVDTVRLLDALSGTASAETALGLAREPRQLEAALVAALSPPGIDQH